MRASVPYEEVRLALAYGLPFIVIASIVLTAGIVSLALWRMRARDPLLLWLGIFAALYGIRLFAFNDLVRVVFGLNPALLRPAINILTFFLSIPGVLFFRELIGEGWKRSITMWLWAEMAFAPLATGLGLATGDWRWGNAVNAWLVIAGTLVALANMAGAEGVIAPRISVTVFAAFALAQNLFGWRVHDYDVEPAGFLILIGGLGYAAAQRAMDRDRKLVAVEQELATARRIQASILPKRVPELAGLSISARYEPMTAVAGDFYDFSPIDAQRVTILVADVSGHGVPAALIASMLKVGFAMQSVHANDPARVLAGLNATLAGTLDGQFVTAACAFIDLEAGSITYAGAGHPPALLLRGETREVIELAENGLMLGPFQQAKYANVTAAFHRGDTLLMYTDGIIEASMADGQPFGGERLTKVLRNHNGGETLAAQVIHAVSGRDQEDDLTVVVAQTVLPSVPLP